MSNRFTLYESTWENVDSELIKESTELLDLDPNTVETPVVDTPAAEADANEIDTTESDPFEEFFSSYEPYEPSPYTGDYSEGGDFDDFYEATSWENIDVNKLKESIALPGGMLNAEPTEYEKELDKHNQARKNNKVSNPESVGDPDCGEIGVHDYKESGAPTDVKEKVTTDIKATELKPNKNAVEVDQKKKWDD